MINGNTEIIAHIGFPTHAFKAPMIYNPWFEKAGVNAIVVPMGCQTPDYPVFLRALFKLTNIRGALITMSHKVPTVGLVDELLPFGCHCGRLQCPDASTFVGEVVMKTELTAFLETAKAQGCHVQIGSDMLFEQIPAYLEFFGLQGEQ